MKIQEAFQKQRVRTDRSLEEERFQTDSFLEEKSKEVESQIDARTRRTRRAADQETEQRRKLLDQKKKAERSQKTGNEISQVDDRIIDREREILDEAKQDARRQEDRSRKTERAQKMNITDAILESERRDTDGNLLSERQQTDDAALKGTLLLTQEKSQHRDTKSALMTRDEFLAIVSHDLKNPLSAITLSSQTLRRLAQKTTPSTEAVLRCVANIERSAHTMERMISDLLDVERMSNHILYLNRKRVDVCSLLQETQTLFAPAAANRNFTFTTQTDRTQIFAVLDRDRIMQVLSNLVGNAFKFTPAHGAIQLQAAIQDEQVQISVSDNGPGIPEQKQATIFDRFTQLQNQDRRGLGLGLYISKWITEAHQGTIRVASAPGQGSRFTLTLPLAGQA